MRRLLFVVTVCALSASCQTVKKAIPKKQSASEKFYARQDALFEKAEKELIKMGRVPPTGFNKEEYLGQYGWHTRAELSSVGSQAPLWLLQSSGDEGAFGAYTFFQPAFEQAKRTWVVNGFMLPDTDLVWITSNAKFDKSVIGRKIEFMYEESCYLDDGNTPCEPEFKSHSRELKDATVVEVYGHTYEWESFDSGGGHAKGPEYWRGPLKLNKRAPAFMHQYYMTIKPSDWTDMCACTTYSTPASTTSDKPCVQGGTLLPGESCSVSIPVGGSVK